jgi:hypothetical protein
MIPRQRDAEQLAAIQNGKLSEIVDYAIREIKYYRECFGDVRIKSVHG